MILVSGKDEPKYVQSKLQVENLLIINKNITEAIQRINDSLDFAARHNVLMAEIQLQKANALFTDAIYRTDLDYINELGEADEELDLLTKKRK